MRFQVDPGSIHPGPASWILLFVLVALLPAMVVAQQRRLARDAALAASLDRRAVYLSALLTHAMLLAGTLLALRELGAGVVVPLLPARLVDVAAASAVLLIGLLPVVWTGWGDAGSRERSALLAPRSTREFLAFSGVSLSAGVVEELAYRCVLFALLVGVVGHWIVAMLIAAAAFGIAHGFQGWRGALAATGIAILAQLALGFTGNVLLIIAVHVLHDLVAGAVIRHRALRAATPSGGAHVAV